jgi:hypothetical protein
MKLEINKAGRRYYLLGNTYELRNRLRIAGCKWDGEKKAWWTRNATVAAQLADSNSDSSTDSLSSDTTIAGKASYKGREYLLLWEGETRCGPAAKLAFRDGTKVFWTKGEYTVTKRYRTSPEPMTFGRLQRLRSEYTSAKHDGHDSGISDGRRYECPECGEYVVRGDGSTCWETGFAH